MKKYIKIILLVALILPFTACKEEFLEFAPEDSPSVDGWYRNEAEIRSVTATLYGRPWFEFNDVLSWCVGDLLAGDMHHTFDEETQFFDISFGENNSIIENGWKSLYDVVSFANVIIDDMPPVANSNGVDQEIIDRALGEARFVRGMAYYYLVEYWGAVPILEKPGDKISNNDLFLPKNTIASVYEFIRRDFDFAASNLPTADTEGRVTSWSAKGMLAKLHVTLAQRSAGGGEIGSAEDFDIAADYAADVINNSGLSLYPNYENMFRPENELNDEILFALRWTTSAWGVGNSRQARFARSSLVANNQAWGIGKGVTVDYIQTLEANAEGATDSRRRAIYMESGDFYDYISQVTGGYTYNISAITNDASDNPINESATPTLTSLKKYVVGLNSDHGFNITDQDSPLDNYMLRLADIYLIYAEALLGTGDQLAGGPGYEAYLAVRSRAGLNAPLDGSMSFRDLFNERRIELGLEAMSWLDIKRQYYRNASATLDLINNQDRAAAYFRIDANDNLINDQAGYELIGGGQSGIINPGNSNPNQSGQMTPGRMILPIPGNEVALNPLLGAGEEPVEYVFD